MLAIKPLLFTKRTNLWVSLPIYVFLASRHVQISTQFYWFRQEKKRQNLERKKRNLTPSFPSFLSGPPANSAHSFLPARRINQIQLTSVVSEAVDGNDLVDTSLPNRPFDNQVGQWKKVKSCHWRRLPLLSPSKNIEWLIITKWHLLMNQTSLKSENHRYFDEQGNHRFAHYSYWSAGELSSDLESAYVHKGNFEYRFGD